MKHGKSFGTRRFKVLEPVSHLHEVRALSSDSQYWKSLQLRSTVKEFGAVSHIDIQPTSPHDIAVSTATRIQVYSRKTNERIKTYSRFHNTVYGASYRNDGKLLVAGNEDGQVRLFDIEGRVPLRIFKGHAGPVHVSKFCNDMTSIFTAGDDKTVRVWDVATEQNTCKFSEHGDYIRTGVTNKSSNDIIATGSYDHCIKMYDRRSKSSILTVNHKMPVESILIYPSGTLLLSAGGNLIKVWDLLQGGKLLTTVSHHHKTITCMAFNHDCSRLLSGSLDRHIKIYDVTSYNVVHNIDNPAPVLSMAISNEDEMLVVGMVDKMLSIRHRKDEKNKNLESDLLHSKKKTLRNYYMQGKDYVPNNDDTVIHDIQLESLSNYDKYFRRFEHSKALDSALLPHIPPEVTVAVMQELIRRGKMGVALAGRTNKKLIELLKFIIRNITKMSFSSTLTDVADILVDIYASEVQNHPQNVRLWFIKLRDIAKNESELHRQMHSLMGCMDALLASHSLNVAAPKV